MTGGAAASHRPVVKRHGPVVCALVPPLPQQIDKLLILPFFLFVSLSPWLYRVVQCRTAFEDTFNLLTGDPKFFFALLPGPIRVMHRPLVHHVPQVFLLLLFHGAARNFKLRNGNMRVCGVNNLPDALPGHTDICGNSVKSLTRTVTVHAFPVAVWLGLGVIYGGD